jgi:hypothetical protein
MRKQRFFVPFDFLRALRGFGWELAVGSWKLGLPL